MVDTSKGFTSIVSPNSKIIPVLIFGILTLFIYYNVGVFDHIKDKPNSVHTWAQSDRASVAACYFNEDMNFFKPRIYNRSNGNNPGICGMEFPIINYTAAICYKVFGFQEMYYRLINFILLFGGLIAAFQLCNIFIKDVIISATIVWLFMMSHVLFFYSANFLPDTGSLGLVLISWYLFFRMGLKPGNRITFLFFIIISLACLIKVTSMVSLIAMVILIAARHFYFIQSDGIPKFNRQILIGFVICLVSVFAWYRYAAWLNDTYQNYFFIMKANTIASAVELRQILRQIYAGNFIDYYPLLMKQLIAVSFGIFVISIFAQNRMLALVFILLLLGFAGFAFAMLKQFKDHDYYIIAMMPVVFFLFLANGEFIKRKLKPGGIFYVVIISVLLVVVNMSMILCKKFYQNKRYGKGYYFISYWEYDRFTNMGPYLDSISVGRNDKVITYYDLTPNASLYLLNRKGTTVKYGDIGRLNSLISTNNFKYLIINDTARFTKELFSFLEGKKVADKYRLQVYRLHE